jgi:hypothetical protein
MSYYEQFGPSISASSLRPAADWGAAAGFRLMWRRQAVLWWIFVVNLVCGVLGAIPGDLRLRRTIGHSLAGETLRSRFDLGMFFELNRLPTVSLTRFTTTSYLFVFIFFVFMLFAMGGVLQSYRDDRRLTAGEFFGASGAYFWRFVRLLLLSIVPFVVVGTVYQALDAAADRVGNRAIADEVGIFLGWGAMVVFALLALAVRLWFDMAQVRAVAIDERRMWRNIWRASRIMRGSFAGLYWRYLCIALVGWITFGIAFLIWTKLPATATGAVLVLLELLVITQIATRLWQLATATVWYQANPEPLPVTIVEPVPTPPVQQEAVESEPGTTGVEALGPQAPDEPAVPPAQPGPELPPADA